MGDTKIELSIANRLEKKLKLSERFFNLAACIGGSLRQCVSIRVQK